MPAQRKNHLYLQQFILFGLLVVLGLTGCVTEPEGAGVEGFTRIADKLRARGDDKGAVDMYQRALQRDPKDIHARTALGEIVEAHGGNAEAANQYRKALELAPDDGSLHRDLGRVLIKLNQPMDAKDQYDQALRTDPRDVKALNGLGVALDFLGRHEAAQNAYKDALDNKEDDPATMANLAHSYVLSGAYAEAIKLLEPHVKDRNAPSGLRQNLAEAYGMAGMDADAERVGLMDLTPQQVKRNIEFYHKRRMQLTPTAGLVAGLGSFATQALAEAQMEHVKTVFAKDITGLVLNVVPEVKNIGGTPKFALQATGFSRADKLRAFCGKLKQEHVECKAAGIK